MILEKIVTTSTQSKKAETAETAVTSGEKTSPRNEQVLWLGSALISQSMRLVNYGEKVQDASINKFCEQLKLFEDTVNELDFTESKLIQFLIRDPR